MKAVDKSEACKKVQVAFNLLFDKLKLFRDGKIDQLR